MIFRRMSEAIARQDWFVVLIEVLVVVVGIFLGLQVDDWNESRKDRQDELVFLDRLHADVLLAGELSSRLRQRRLTYLENATHASDILFGRGDRDSLDPEECTSMVSIGWFNINAPGLSSVSELAGTGRMDIVRNPALRQALAEFQQTRTGLNLYINVQTTSVAGRYLPALYPELISIDGYFETETNEIRGHIQCDLAGMRENRAFMNEFSMHLDRYDAYIRDGLAPWINQMDKVHTLVDSALEIEHETKPGE